MLSKFQSKNKPEAKKLSRKAIANLLIRDVDREKEVCAGTGNKTENYLNDRRKKLKWHMNPLYKVKSSNTDESEPESVASLSSRQSYAYSEVSNDSGYKSYAEERFEPGKEPHNESQDLNFHKAATELLDVMKALGAEEEVNMSVKKALVDCEHELEKLNVGRQKSTEMS